MSLPLPPTENRSDPGEAIYLFCIAPGEDLPAVEGTGPDDRSPLFQRSFGMIAAVASAVRVEDWCGPRAEKNLKDISWVGPLACRHEAVVESVMRRSPVFPMQFGTLFSSLGKLEDLLAHHHDRIVGFLNHVSCKEEWALKGLMDRKKTEEFVMVSDPRSNAIPASPGARYLLEKKLRMYAGRQAGEWARTTFGTLEEDLAQMAVESREMGALSQRASGREQEMIFNRALLLEASNRDAFRTAVDQRNATMKETGLLLDLSGPWPPYSFCPPLESEGSPP